MIHRALARSAPLPVSHQPAIFKRVLLGTGELPGLAGFSQAVFAPGDVAPGHRHRDMWEVFFVRAGRGTIRVDGVESALEEDDCWVIEPGESHEIRNDGDTALVLLYFGLEPAAGARHESTGEPHGQS